MHRLTARLTAAAGALAVGSGLLVGLAGPAAAEPGARARFTMWQHDGYQGQAEAREGYDRDLHNDACSGCDPGPGGDFGDDMSSFVNKTPYWVKIYVNKDYDWDDDYPYYSWYCVRPHSHDADLGNDEVKGQLEDEISSIDVMSTRGRPVTCRDYQVLGHRN